MAEIHMLGVSEFKAALERSVARQAAASREAVAKGAHTIEFYAKQQLSIGSHPKNEPTMSRPGEPPELVSGNLRRSVVVQGPTGSGTEFTAKVGPTAIYGRIQELGGWTGHSHLPARPYMKPALADSAGELRSLFKEAWSQW